MALKSVWLIECFGSPRCWIKEPESDLSMGVTFQRRCAQQFQSEDEAIRELLRLNLSRDWFVKKEEFSVE